VASCGGIDLLLLNCFACLGRCFFSLTRSSVDRARDAHAIYFFFFFFLDEWTGPDQKGGDDFLEEIEQPCEINPRYEKAKTQGKKGRVSRERRMIRYPPIGRWMIPEACVQLTPAWPPRRPAHMTPMLWALPTPTCMPLRGPRDLIGPRAELRMVRSIHVVLCALRPPFQEITSKGLKPTKHKSF
jgi:hypothetical protein